MTHIVGAFQRLPVSAPNGTGIMLGNFDGFHKGHQALLNALREGAERKGLFTVAYSFKPHPRYFFLNEAFDCIFTSIEKAAILEGLGLDALVEYEFNGAFAALSPEGFVRDVLKRRLNCKLVVVGEGYRFGRGQAGDSSMLKDICADCGIEVNVVPHIRQSGIKVSSSVIREYIRNVRLSEAAELLTRPYFLRSTAERGKQLGRTLGFPTINQLIPKGKLLPPCGVYATHAHICGREYRSITNIGVNPTIGELSQCVSETHVFEFDESVYGQTVQVDFYRFLRGERRFSSINALKCQIAEDIAARIQMDV